MPPKKKVVPKKKITKASAKAVASNRVSININTAKSKVAPRPRSAPQRTFDFSHPFNMPPNIPQSTTAPHQTGLPIHHQPVLPIHTPVPQASTAPSQVGVPNYTQTPSFKREMKTSATQRDDVSKLTNPQLKDYIKNKNDGHLPPKFSKAKRDVLLEFASSL